MTKQELSQAYDIAITNAADLHDFDIGVFDGFGLPDFKPVYVRIEQVARLIRWQCQYMDGTWDSENLQDIATVGKTKFLII